MNIRFQADANLDPDIERGLQRREPALDYRSSFGIIPDGMKDFDVLLLAAQDNRVLVTADVRTMPKHFADFIHGQNSPGILLIPRGTLIGETIEGILVCWLSWSAEELRNQIWWLPR